MSRERRNTAHRFEMEPEAGRLRTMRKNPAVIIGREVGISCPYNAIKCDYEPCFLMPI